MTLIKIWESRVTTHNSIVYAATVLNCFENNGVHTEVLGSFEDKF